MAEPDRTNADAERVSDIVTRLRDLALNSTIAAADIIEAQSKALAEAREECASIAQDCPGIVRSEHSNVDPFWQGVAAAKVAIMQAIRALTPTPENPNG